MRRETRSIHPIVSSYYLTPYTLHLTPYTVSLRPFCLTTYIQSRVYENKSCGIIRDGKIPSV